MQEAVLGLEKAKEKRELIVKFYSKPLIDSDQNHFFRHI